MNTKLFEDGVLRDSGPLVPNHITSDIFYVPATSELEHIGRSLSLTLNRMMMAAI